MARAAKGEPPEPPIAAEAITPYILANFSDPAKRLLDLHRALTTFKEFCQSGRFAADRRDWMLDYVTRIEAMIPSHVLVIAEV